MNNRRFVQLFTLVLLIFVLANFVVWKCWTEQLLTTRHGEGGDLARLGYLPQFKLQRKNQDDLPRRHLSFNDYAGQPVDVLTIGDSFANGGGGGRNRFFQDYLASFSNVSVLHLGLYRESPVHPTYDPVRTLLVLFNSGELERISPRAVLLSVSVKQAVDMLAYPLDPTLTAPITRVRDPRSYFGYDAAPDYSGVLGFLSGGNLKYLYSAALYRCAGKTNRSVAIAPLTRPLFSVQGTSLLYLKADVNKIGGNRTEALAQINANLNQMAALLAKRGTKLYFMPCVDKYDLYAPYLAGARKAENRFFDDFRTLPKNYRFIDTKEILSPLVQAGVKDVFYPDDTHWSWLAAQRIFQSVQFP